ncbi:hypothetical protein KIPB_006961, partial [Kipferlia bialata]
EVVALRSFSTRIHQVGAAVKYRGTDGI